MCDGKSMGKSSLRGKSSMTGQFPIAMIVYSMVCGSMIDSADFWSEKIRKSHDSTMKKRAYHDLCSMLNQFDVFDPNSAEET